MDIFLTSKFKKSYKWLPEYVKEKTREKEKIFKQNPFNPILETHHLYGEYKDYLAFSIDRSYRIMFQFLNAAKTKAAFINIGTHDIYK